MFVVPVYNVVVLPEARLLFPTESFKKRTGKEPEEGDHGIILVQRRDLAREELQKDSFYPICVAATIKEVNTSGYLVIETTARMNVEAVDVTEDHELLLNFSPRPEIRDTEEEEEHEKLERLKAALIAYTSGFQWGPIARTYIMQWHNLNEIGAGMSQWLGNSPKEKYQLLAVDHRSQRNDLIEKAMYEYIEISKLTSEAETEQEQDYRKAYRENAIKKQMEYLQKQLDEMHPENVSDVRRFELKLQESGMNEEARKEADKVLNRLKQESQNSAESGLLYDYLDFVTGLSWKKEPPETINLEEAQTVLDEDHFGMKKVKDRIIQQIAVMDLQHKQSGSILCFVGAPGTGKTSIGQSIARALHRKYVRVSLGGVRDEADIRGHRRTYIGAMPGRIMDGISKSGVTNPVMVLDEIDKLGASYNGDPASALLEVLDPEQNGTFTDHYMNVPYDLSDVLFICTANSLDTIPEPLLNRMEVINFPGYTASDKLEIGKRHLLPKAMESMGIREDDLEISDDVLRHIIDNFTAESGVRGLKKRLDTLCRVAAVEIVKSRSTETEAPEHEEALEHEDTLEHEGTLEHEDMPPSSTKIIVEAEELRKYLDMAPISHEHVQEEKRPGIVTGLAWTSAGGEILFIETLFTKGSGKVIITGQLGDVMKESVQIAISLVKSLFPEKENLFEENDLHVHVPAGAVPKDGPSAGITLTTALASLVTGKAVNPKLAMTGEVSLRGVVTPIGGLPEKLMAAQRAGVEQVFIPKENVDDLEEVPQEAKEKLSIQPVAEVQEVLKLAGLLEG